MVTHTHTYTHTRTTLTTNKQIHNNDNNKNLMTIIWIIKRIRIKTFHKTNQEKNFSKKHFKPEKENKIIYIILPHTKKIFYFLVRGKSGCINPKNRFLTFFFFFLSPLSPPFPFPSPFSPTKNTFLQIK